LSNQKNDYNEMMRGAVPTPGQQEEEGLQTNGDKSTPTPGVLYLRESLVKRVKGGWTTSHNLE
jgi:hypothetical protein